ncbi:MAG: carboxylesterase family protein [Planctomycetes bacterium]|nr:carboxylesterase family protein [Planctomycetota bacterium]
MRQLLIFSVVFFHATAAVCAQAERGSLMSRFDEVDRNGDGKVTAQELPRPALFRRLDRNGDGVIERDEVGSLRGAGGATRAPDWSNLERHLDIPYAQIEGIDPKLLSLDVYTAKDAERRRPGPVMVYVHGGGWQRGDKAAVGRKAEFFTGEGWVLVSVNYRLLPEGKHPSNADDVAAALAWVHEHVAEYGGDARRIFLMGHSAGCHLVSLVATNGRHLEKADKSLDLVRGVVALDTQAYDIPKLVQGRLSPALYVDVFGEDVQTQRDASPIHHVANDKGIPPFLICYSSGMGARRNPNRSAQAEAFAVALKAAGIEAEVVDASDRNHGQINQRFGDPEDEKVTGRAEVFWSGILGKGEAFPRGAKPASAGNAR